MIDIVIEGHDAAGKSTLADALGNVLRLPVQSSEGPPKWRGEVDERIRSYFRRAYDVIYDRHPCVSEPIYIQTRLATSQAIDDRLIETFYARRPIIIYCDPLERGLAAHNAKDHDTPEHLERIQAHYDQILRSYREWAIRHALLVYRIGDEMNNIISAVEHLYAGRHSARHHPSS